MNNIFSDNIILFLDLIKTDNKLSLIREQIGELLFDQIKTSLIRNCNGNNSLSGYYIYELFKAQLHVVSMTKEGIEPEEKQSIKNNNTSNKICSHEDGIQYSIDFIQKKIDYLNDHLMPSSIYEFIRSKDINNYQEATLYLTDETSIKFRVDYGCSKSPSNPRELKLWFDINYDYVNTIEKLLPLNISNDKLLTEVIKFFNKIMKFRSKFFDKKIDNFFILNTYCSRGN